MQPDNNNKNRPPRQNGGNKRPPKPGNNSNNGNQQTPRSGGVSRGAAVRAQKRTQMDAQRIANQFTPAQPIKKGRANVIDDSPRLKIIGLGGMDGGGSKTPFWWNT